MLGKKKFEKIAQKELLLKLPKPPFTRLNLGLSVLRNKKRYLNASMASVGRPKIAERLSKIYEVTAGEFRELGKIKIPKGLSAKQRKKFRKNKIWEYYVMIAQQKETATRFKIALCQGLYEAMFNPRKGYELETQFRDEPAAEKIEQIIHNFSREREFKKVEIQINGKPATHIPALEEVANQIMMLVLAPQFKLQLETLKGAATQNTK